MTRNILNLSDVDTFVETCCGYARGEEIATWLRSTVRRWIIKHYDLAYPVHLADDHVFVASSAGVSLMSFSISGVPDWAIRALHQKQPLYYLRINEPLLERVRQVIDYLHARRDLPEINRLSRLSFPQAEVATDLWHQALTRQKKHLEESDDGIETIMEFENGYRIVNLLTEPALEREGSIMGHCVGSYADQLGDSYEILSLRDHKNEPHCTIELSDQNLVTQIKGKANTAVKSKYAEYVVRFITDMGMTVSHDGQNVGLYQFFGDYYRDINVVFKSPKWERNCRQWCFDPTDVEYEFSRSMGMLIRNSHLLTEQTKERIHELFCPHPSDYFRTVRKIDLCGDEFTVIAMRYPSNYLVLCENGCLPDRYRNDIAHLTTSAVDHLYSLLEEDDRCLFILGDLAIGRRKSRLHRRYLDFSPLDALDDVLFPATEHLRHASTFLEKSVFDFTAVAQRHKRRCRSRFGRIYSARKAELHSYGQQAPKRQKSLKLLQKLMNSKYVW